MKHLSPISRWVERAAALGAGLHLSFTASAFPPAPHHTLYGMARDQLGNPLQDSTARILLTVGDNPVIQVNLAPDYAPGENFELAVPMDSGLTSDVYQPTALLPAAPFRLKVEVGGVTYVPIEMTGNLAKLGSPGGRTHIDLTLGTSSDGDGLPDAWKKAVIQRLGLKISPSAIHPGDRFPGSGLSYYQVYLAGTYYLAPNDGFRLKIGGMSGKAAQLQFTAVVGHSYSIQAATELDQWKPVQFTIPSSGSHPALLDLFTATNTVKLLVEAAAPSGSQAPAQFYRLLVQ